MTGFGGQLGNVPGSEWLRRLMESPPDDWRARYVVGARVKLIRADTFGAVPVGAEGVIVDLADDETAMAMKGRPLFVKFDLRPFNLPYPPEWRQALESYRTIDPPGGVVKVPEFLTTLSTYFGANDLEILAGPAEGGTPSPASADAPSATSSSASGAGSAEGGAP